uniref:Uncharacterized protein n=1 Tax=Romanomermis culicivorax TaxID=13658 RepID=A0A915HER0_ROMCU
MASRDTAFEILESLFNINDEDTYFGSLFEAEFAKYSALDLGQTVRKDVNYGTYLFHFILGSILLLPRTRLYNKLSIEDVFLKVESIDSNKPNVIKVFTTFVGHSEKTVHYRIFDFHDGTLISDEQKLTNQDLEQLSYELNQKGRNMADYVLSSARHLKIFQPSTGLYKVVEDWKIEGSQITIADHFRAIPSSKSPIVVRQFPISIIQWEKNLPVEGTKSEFIDVLDQVFDKFEQLNFPSLQQETEQIKLQLNDLLTRMAKIYQNYDMKYNLKLSTSRIDHCGFIHGALSMNLKVFHQVSLHVVNREMNHHDNIQMIIMSNSEDLLEKMTQKPIVVDFKDVDTARAAAKATEYVSNKKVVKLPAHIQTLADECIYTAICLTSIHDPVSIIDAKIEPKPNGISSLIIENAEEIYNRYVDMQENNMLYQSHRQNFVETLSYAFDTVQSTNRLTVMDDVRCISRYFVGEAGTSAKIYIGRELEYELDPLIDDLRKHLTTFVIETTIPTLDVVVNLFETRVRYPFDSVYDATDDVQIPRTRETVSHTIVINVMSWFTDFAFSTRDESASPVKNFLKRKISVEPIRKFSTDPDLVEQLITRLPSVDIYDLILNVDEVVLPSPRRSNQLEPFFHECQQLINNPHELISVVGGIFSPWRKIQEIVKTAVGNRLVGCQIMPLQEKEYQSLKVDGPGSLSKLRVLSFSFLDRPLSMTSGNGMFHNFPTSLARTSNIEIASCNVIFNKRGQKSKKNIVKTIMDYNSNLKNFKRLLKSCTKYDGLMRTKRRGICELQLDSDTKLADSNAKLIKLSDFHANLRTVQKISLITAHGMIIKDMVADIANGDLKGLCFNMGFISGGFAASHLADKVLGLGTRLSGVGSRLGEALMLSSPFIRRATSGLIIYDLINSIQRYKNNDTEAVVDIAEDGVFLSVDALDIGVDIAEAFGLAEGLSTFTGPIGLGVGVVVMIGGEIYK